MCFFKLALFMLLIVLCGCTIQPSTSRSLPAPTPPPRSTPLPPVPGSSLVSGMKALEQVDHGEQNLAFTGIISGSTSSFSITYKASDRDSYTLVSMRQQAGQTIHEEITRIDDQAWALNPQVAGGKWRELTNQEVNRLPPESNEFAAIYVPNGFLQQIVPELAGYPPIATGSATVNGLPAQLFTIDAQNGNFAGQPFQTLHAAYAVADSGNYLLQLSLKVTGASTTSSLSFDLNPTATVAIAPPAGFPAPQPVPVLQALRAVGKLKSFEVVVRSNVHVTAQDASGVVTQTQRFAAPDSWEVSSTYEKLHSKAIYVRSGNDYWRQEQGQQWQHLSPDEASAVNDEFPKLFLVNSTTDLLRTFAVPVMRSGRTTTIGTETVNGIPTRHDRTEATGNGQSSIAFDSLVVDNWIATPGDYLAKMRLRMVGKNIGIELDWDLTNPDGTIAITSPPR